MKPFVPQKLPLGGIDWESLISLIGQANRSIAHYGGILHGVPNPEVLLAPLTTQEAVLSSKIEGTQATLGEVLRFEAGDEPEQESRRLDIHEIINYRRAMFRAEKELESRPFNLNLLLELHRILLAGVRGKDKARGTFRRSQNWIGAAGTPIEQADYVPPEPLLVEPAMDNWEKYYHAQERDPLVQLAIVHAQFEIIHPFLDGNGRLGRILIPLFLAEKGLLPRPMFYLSAYLEEHRDEYVANLRTLGTDQKSWTRWLAFFLQAVNEQAGENAAKAREIIALYEKMKTRVIELTHSQHAVPLLDQMFRTPLFRSTDLKLAVDRSPSRQSITHLISVLRENGILSVVREAKGRRAQVLAFAELLNLCEGKAVF